MTKSQYQIRHQAARAGNLGTLACSLCGPAEFQWFLTQVYDLRFPHIGDSRHNVPRTFDSLARRSVRPWHVVRHARMYRRATFGAVVSLP